jgi:DNA-directed RNA polymerase subunit K/omega
MKADKSTRSSKVFAAEITIDNRFLLCRVAAVYARRLQKTRIQFAESINQSLRLISDLPRGHMDVANLPPLPIEEIPVLEPAAAAISL